ncbi:MAG: aminotransferase, partial [Blastocatellia bacterium]|nr:aminotransferase [Blastocatellia bacterium]
MFDTKMPARKMINALKKEKVYIGRVWPVWPTYARVTIGSKDDMAKFKTALVKVMNDLQA